MGLCHISGSVSDRQIIERSTLLDSNKFSPGESIMADREIMTQDLFATQKVYVNTPLLLKGKISLIQKKLSGTGELHQKEFMLNV